jgi:DNA-binding NtrC family response regulator
MLTKFNANIFLVDDDVLCLNLYKQFLKQLGYNNVQLFDNGNDCLQSLASQQPDIIFLDYNMDDLNGLDVLRQIKQFNSSIIVLFISGQEDILIAVKTIQQGALDYIVKSSLNPDKLKTIMERVESLLPDKTASKPASPSFFKKLFS